VRRLDHGTGPAALTFGPTSGAISGVVGVGCGLVVAASALFGGLTRSGLPYLFGGLAVAVLSWAILLRPRIRMHADEVELRNSFSSWLVPYALITGSVVRSYAVVRVGERKYAGLGLGRPRRSMTRTRRDAPPREGVDITSGKSLAGADEADLFESALDERVRAAPAADSPRVVRRWAIPEILALAVCLIGMVVSIAVR